MLLDGGTDFVQFVEPSGRSGHGRHTQPGQPNQVDRSRLRHRELDRDIDAFKCASCDPLAMWVLLHVQPQHHIEAELRRQLLDQPAHFAVTNQREFFVGLCWHVQSKTFGSSFEKNSLCRAVTAETRSCSAMTKPRFRSDAPWEIIRIFLSSSTWNARPAIPGVWRMFSPTRHTMAWSVSMETSENCRSSPRISSRCSV